IEDSGVVEVVPERVVEGLQQFGVLGVGGRGFEAGCGEAHALDAEPGAGANPVLRGAGGRQQKEQRDNRDNSVTTNWSSRVTQVCAPYLVVGRQSLVASKP